MIKRGVKSVRAEQFGYMRKQKPSVKVYNGGLVDAMKGDETLV
jgi:hypothetical protein